MQLLEDFLEKAQRAGLAESWTKWSKHTLAAINRRRWCYTYELFGGKTKLYAVHSEVFEEYQELKNRVHGICTQFTYKETRIK